MNYAKLKQTIKTVPVFTSKMLCALSGEHPQLVRNQLFRWRSRGLVEKLGGGMYLLHADDRGFAVNEYYLSNMLYEPSYVSLESALSYYGIIPEGVHVVSAITTRKTRTFTNRYGRFYYHCVQPGAFCGFVSRTINGLNVFMAEKEKAIVDYLYFRCRSLTVRAGDSDFFEQSLRFQQLDGLNAKKLKHWGALYKTKKLMGLIAMLRAAIRKR